MSLFSLFQSTYPLVLSSSTTNTFVIGNLSSDLLTAATAELPQTITTSEPISTVSLSPSVQGVINESIDQNFQLPIIPEEIKILEPPEKIREIVLAEPTQSTETPFVVPISMTMSSDFRVFADTTERHQGAILAEQEKPVILASIANNINNGFAKSCILVIRKFKSERGYPEYYEVFRKTLFKDSEFAKIAKLDNVMMVASKSFTSIAEMNNLKLSDILTFEDSSIESGQIYVYKIVVKWNRGKDSDQTLPSSLIIPNIGL
jgi:hypothetical protein